MIRRLLISLLALWAFVSAAQAQISLNLRDADLRNFVEIVSEETGRNFILDPRVRGTVTVYAPSSINAEALYEIFLNVMELNRLTIVQGDEVDRIVPLDLARELSGSGIAIDGSYETRVITLDHLRVTDAIEIVRPLLPQEAVLSGLPNAGLLILSDRRENQDRIAQLLARLDTPPQSSIATIRLRNGDATEMLQTLLALEITPPGSSLSADQRSNSVVVSGTPDFQERIRLAIGELDIPRRSLQTVVVRLNYADAAQLESVVARSFGAALATAEGETGPGGEVSVVADAQSNALVVTAPSDRIASIEASIRQLDRRPEQVLIEAVVFELSVENFSDLSVQFAGLLNDIVAGGVEFNLSGRPSLSSVVAQAATGGSAFSIGAGGTIGAGAQNEDGVFLGFLSALASQTSTRLLSTPSIMTLNNSEAEIVVAQNVPFVTGSFAQVGESANPDRPFQTIQRQDIGLTLRVTPQITSDNTVRMAISQEVSSLTNVASAAGGEITNRRTLDTNVLVSNGRVIMLGGLLENGSRSVDQGVPGLRELPLVGGLFRGRNTNGSQKVLLILIRPRIVSDDNEAERLTREVAADTRAASAALSPLSDNIYPPLPDTTFPFDGYDLNQPFDVQVIDPVGRAQNFPPLPRQLEFE